MNRPFSLSIKKKILRTVFNQQNPTTTEKTTITGKNLKLIIREKSVAVTKNELIIEEFCVIKASHKSNN